MDLPVRTLFSTWTWPYPEADIEPAQHGVSAGSFVVKQMSSRYGVQTPVTRHALQLRRPAIHERQPGSRYEVSNSARDEDLARSCLACDARTYMHRDAADRPIDDLAFSGVKSCSDLKSKFAYSVGDRRGTADGACRPVEAREEPVARDIHLDTSVAHEFSPDQSVMSFEGSRHA
jgi:hypothetical protein